MCLTPAIHRVIKEVVVDKPWSPVLDRDWIAKVAKGCKPMLTSACRREL